MDAKSTPLIPWIYIVMVFLWIGVVEVVVDGCSVAVVLDDTTLIAFADVGDVFSTEPLFCLLNDEDVLLSLLVRSTQLLVRPMITIFGQIFYRAHSIIVELLLSGICQFRPFFLF